MMTRMADGQCALNVQMLFFKTPWCALIGVSAVNRANMVKY